MIKVPGKSHAELLEQARKRGLMLLYLTENKKYRGIIAHDDYFDYNNHYIDNFLLNEKTRNRWLAVAEELSPQERKELDLIMSLIGELCKQGQVIFDWERALVMHPTRLYNEFIKFAAETVTEKFLALGRKHNYDIPEQKKRPRPDGDGGQQPR